MSQIIHLQSFHLDRWRLAVLSALNSVTILRRGNGRIWPTRRRPKQTAVGTFWPTQILRGTSDFTALKSPCLSHFDGKILDFIQINLDYIPLYLRGIPLRGCWKSRKPNITRMLQTINALVARSFLTGSNTLRLGFPDNSNADQGQNHEN